MASFKQIREAAKYNPYAIGMAAAKKKAGIGSAHATNLPKSVIVKGHEIAKKIKANEEFDEVLDQLDEITSPMQKLRDALDRHSEKALAANKCGDDEACKVHQNYMNKIKDKMAKLAKNESVELEDEVEILDELDKSTLASYAKKSHDQLLKHTGTVNMKYGRGDKDATAYALDKDALRKTANRTQGIKTALNKLTKEDAEPMLTYAEFMAQLSEGKADDLRDKLAADRERRLNNYDYSKEKDHTPSSVRKVKGHSYGAGEDSEEGEDDVKPAKPEAVKRGRGRPAGSKSGARV